MSGPEQTTSEVLAAVHALVEDAADLVVGLRPATGRNVRLRVRTLPEHTMVRAFADVVSTMHKPRRDEQSVHQMLVEGYRTAKEVMFRRELAARHPARAVVHSAADVPRSITAPMGPMALENLAVLARRRFDDRYVMLDELVDWALAVGGAALTYDTPYEMVEDDGVLVSDEHARVLVVSSLWFCNVPLDDALLLDVATGDNPLHLAAMAGTVRPLPETVWATLAGNPATMVRSAVAANPSAPDHVRQVAALCG
jgi:hypothetical protein